MGDDVGNRLIGIDNLWPVGLWTRFELEGTVGKFDCIVRGDLKGSEIHCRCDAGCGLGLLDEDGRLRGKPPA